MDKNKFDIIQEWHELLKAGIITEEDFNKKKQELLKVAEVPVAKKEVIETYDKETSKITVEKVETVSQDTNDWVEENKVWLIGLFVAIIAVVAFIWYSSKEKDTETNLYETPIQEESNSPNSPVPYNWNHQQGYTYYVVKIDAGERSYFYTEPNFSTRRNAYLVTDEVVYVYQIENGFGYVEFTNSRGQISKGWIVLDDLSYCPDCNEVTQGYNDPSEKIEQADVSNENETSSVSEGIEAYKNGEPKFDETQTGGADDEFTDIYGFVQKRAAPNEGIQKFYQTYARKFNPPDVGADVNEVSVRLKFVVEKDGSFTNIQVVGSDPYNMGPEAIRVLKTMPKWNPAEHKGEYVRSSFTLPIKIYK